MSFVALRICFADSKHLEAFVQPISFSLTTSSQVGHDQPAATHE